MIVTLHVWEKMRSLPTNEIFADASYVGISVFSTYKGCLHWQKNVFCQCMLHGHKCIFAHVFFYSCSRNADAMSNAWAEALPIGLCPQFLSTHKKYW